MKKSRIAIIVISATLTIGTLAVATGMKHCHRNHTQMCGISSEGEIHPDKCHHGDTTARLIENHEP